MTTDTKGPIVLSLPMPSAHTGRMQRSGPDIPETSFAARLDDAQASVAAANDSCPDAARSTDSLQSMLRSRPSTEVAFATFSGVLATLGLREALAFLVKLSDYRFIGIFRFEDGRANAAVHVDREHPEVLTLDEVPETATYCCRIRDGGAAFTTVHASADVRLREHVARDVVQSYCGIPLTDREGVFIGTLCHYDVVPRAADRLDLSLLLQVASALAKPGVVPPYPAMKPRG